MARSGATPRRRPGTRPGRAGRARGAPSAGGPRHPTGAPTRCRRRAGSGGRAPAPRAHGAAHGRTARRSATSSRRPGSKTRTPEPPSALAAYIARSASARPSASSGCGHATPTDTPTETSCSPIDTPSATASTMRSATPMTSSCVAPSMRMANSSPASRATVSTTARSGHAPGDGLEHDVARLVAVGVVHRLEPVEVAEQQRHVVPAGQRLAQPVDEQRPVGQARELVVERAVLQRPLEDLLVAHVADAEEEPTHGRVVAQVAARPLAVAPPAVGSGDADGEHAPGARRGGEGGELGEGERPPSSGCTQWSIATSSTWPSKSSAGKPSTRSADGLA